MSSVELIQSSEVEYSPLSLVDESGRVFFWRGRVLRAVTAESAPEMRARFDSGLVAALRKRDLIPETRITELRMDGFALIVEHARIPVITLPYEWTYGMLRAAAACVLETNEVANAHGWELKDCHGYNVLFEGPSPRYIDLGSFVRRREGQRGWSAYEEFVRFYLYPLQVWQGGDNYTARHWLATADNVPHESALLYRHPMLRRIGGAAKWARLLREWHRFRRLSGTREETIRRGFSSRRANILLWLRRQAWLPGQSVDLAGERRRLRARERRWMGSVWSEYQSTFDVTEPTPRFRRVLEIVRELRPRRVLELGGNQGWLAHQILTSGAAEEVICTDGDEEAVDRAFREASRLTSGLNTAVLDFIFPLSAGIELPPAQRLGADVVLALAVSHHVLLTQKISVERFFTAVGSFARRHVLIEFMPLGLWDGRSAPPLPDWYRREWFRAQFSQAFKLIAEEVLEENRILFVGEIRSAADRVTPAAIQANFAPAS